jgi:hypothetical protein
MKLKMRCIRFMNNNVRTTMLDEQMIKQPNKLCKYWEVIKFYSCQLFYLKLSYQRQKLRQNLKIEFFKRPHMEKNHQTKGCMFWNIMKLCSRRLFGLKSSCHAKLRLNFKIRIFQTTLGWKTTKIKIVGLEML